MRGICLKNTGGKDANRGKSGRDKTSHSALSTTMMRIAAKFVRSAFVIRSEQFQTLDGMRRTPRRAINADAAIRNRRIERSAIQTPVGRRSEWPEPFRGTDCTTAAR